VPPSRHDHDAGGDRELLERTAELRDRIWSRLEESDVSRFPGARGRIPNFAGAEEAAERLRGRPEWRATEHLKANPDSPKWPVRQRALEDGKVVYMAVPQLADEHPFFLLDPDRLEAPPRQASSITGASRNGITAGVDEMEPVNLVVTGCVAVSPDGRRLGKGGGFSDLEYAVALEAGIVDAETPVVTTVHELQVVDEGEIPVTGHDVRLDLAVTPERVIELPESGRRGRGGIRWEELTEEKIASIPLLRRLREER
jgi:5-formyltetrahydrofolate cyclo-ligase